MVHARLERPPAAEGVPTMAGADFAEFGRLDVIPRQQSVQAQWIKVQAQFFGLGFAVPFLHLTGGEDFLQGRNVLTVGGVAHVLVCHLRLRIAQRQTERVRGSDVALGGRVLEQFNPTLHVAVAIALDDPEPVKKYRARGWVSLDRTLISRRETSKQETRTCKWLRGCWLARKGPNGGRRFRGCRVPE